MLRALGLSIEVDIMRHDDIDQIAGFRAVQ